MCPQLGNCKLIVDCNIAEHYKFQVKYSRSYKERLSVDFQRTEPSQKVDTLIEVLAIK